MDHREGEGRGAPSGRNVTQDRPACLRRPPIKATRGPPTVSTQYSGLRRQATGKSAGGHHRLDGGYSGAAAVEVGGDRGGVDSISLKNWLLQCGVASIGLRQIVG